MPQYLVMIPDDYDDWVAMTPEQRAAVYRQHDVFAERLQTGGHTVVGGAELTVPSTARTVRRVDGVVSVTDGPYAEAVEQLSGYYVVESDDLPDLEQACGLLAGAVGVEIRMIGRAVEDPS